MSNPSSHSTSPYGLILTTVGSPEEAEQIAQILLAEKLAACISYFPVNSLYHWNEALQNETEYQLMIKTQLHLQKAIEHRFQSIHPYQVPEFLVIPFQGGAELYLSWIGSQVSQDSPNH